MKIKGSGFVLLAAGTMVLSLGAGSALAGNGSPKGKHFNLNLIGVSNPKSATLDDSNGRRIFVPLRGNCKINLTEGDFGVIDGNCTDGDSGFQLPNPDPTNSGTTTYSVFIRALGKPGGSSTTTTCATDPTDGETVCSVTNVTIERRRGKSTFTNVSKDLLYIYADYDGDGDLDRVPLFGSELQDYYWNYDNDGLRLAQLRFYECATVVPDASDPNGQQIDIDCFD